MKLFASVLVLVLASAAVALAADVDSESALEASAEAVAESQAAAAAQVVAETEAITAAVNEAEAMIEADKPKKDDKKKQGDGKTFKPVMIDRHTRHAMYHHHGGVRYTDGGRPDIVHFPARRFIHRIFAGVRRPRAFRMGGFPIRVFGVRRVRAPRPPRKQYFEPIYEDEHAAIQHIKRHIEEARRPRAWRPFVVIGRRSRGHGYGLPIRAWMRRGLRSLRVGPRRRRTGAAGFSLPEFPRMPLSARRHIARSELALGTGSPMQRRLRALKSWLKSLPSVKQLPDGRLRIRHRLFPRGVRGSLSALDWAMERMERLSARLSVAHDKLKRSTAKGSKLRRNKALLKKIRAGMQRLALQIARVERKVRSAGVRVPVESLARAGAPRPVVVSRKSADDFDEEFDRPFYKAGASKKAVKAPAANKAAGAGAGYGFARDDAWRTYADDGEDDDD